MHVVIVGAGLIGLSTAFFLQRAGARVTLIEQHAHPGLGTSYANGGLLTPSMSHPWNEPGIFSVLLRSMGRESSPVLLRTRAIPSLLRWGIAFVREARPARFALNALRNGMLAHYSLEALRLIERSGDLSLSLSSAGTLNLYRHPRELEHGIALSRMIEPAGVRFRELTARELAQLEPALVPIERDLAGGIYFADDRSGDAHAYCRALAEAVLRKGGLILFGARVQGWRHQSQRVLAAQTSRGDICADAFVIAAGSHSRALIRHLALDAPIQPVKGYSISLPLDEVEQPPRIPVVDSSLHAAVAPLGTTLRVAGTAEFAGFDASISQARISNLRGLLRQIYPRIAERTEDRRISAWAGLRPVCSDGVPLIGKTSLHNVYVNTGHGHLGWTLAAGSGRLLSDLITECMPALDPLPYSPLRFQPADAR